MREIHSNNRKMASVEIISSSATAMPSINSTDTNATTVDDESDTLFSIDAIETMSGGDKNDLLDLGLMDLESSINNESIMEGALEESNSSLDDSNPLCKKCK